MTIGKGPTPVPIPNTAVKPFPPMVLAATGRVGHRPNSSMSPGLAFERSRGSSFLCVGIGQVEPADPGARGGGRARNAGVRPRRAVRARPRGQVRPGRAEPTVKYHPFQIGILTSSRESGRRTVLRGQFDWGGLLLKSNGGAQRHPQHGWQSCVERNGIRVLDCETNESSRRESGP